MAVLPLSVCAKEVVIYEVKNAAGKLVCRIDADSGTVEIVQKNCRTIIKFGRNRSISIKNIIDKKPNTNH